MEKVTLPPGTKVPNHLLIIPDGNRRWAKERGLPTLKGHQRGAKISYPLVKTCRDFGIHTLTLWAFSARNWKRSKREVNCLMKIFEDLIDRHLREALKDNVKIVHLGRKDRIPKSLKKKIINAEGKTKNFKKHIFNIALDYEGRDEILRAVEKLIKDYKDKKTEIKNLSEELFAQYLDTASQPYPYPDFLIRTSGEQRTSGILPWQIAYAEFYFEKDHFPDFTPEKLKAAILEYSRRERRFGGN